jgi:hypothetical protein
MEILYWIVIIIFLLFVLWGILDWTSFFTELWHDSGVKKTIFAVIGFLLLCTPAVVKEFVPKYYGLSIWALILYVAAFLFYRHLIVGTHKEDKEG